jgi:hypothetical protein
LSQTRFSLEVSVSENISVSYTKGPEQEIGLDMLNADGEQVVEDKEEYI